jgi:hypothetical protein
LLARYEIASRPLMMLFPATNNFARFIITPSA